MGIEIILTTITALIGGAVSLFFAVISKKIDKLSDEQKERHEELHANDVGNRELLLATAKVAELVARKYDGEGINGELKQATKDLQAEQDNVIGLMKEGYYKRMGDLMQ